MVDALEQLNEIGWFFTILAVILVAVVIVGLVKLWKDLKSSLGLKSTTELEKEQIKKDIVELKTNHENLEKEFHDYCDKHEQDCLTWRGQSIDYRDNFTNNIQKLVDKFDQYIEIDNRRTIATLRTSLWRLHKEFMEQGYVTPDGLKTWTEMGKVYVEAGGNDIFHDKLDPEVSALPIHYPEGSIYNHE